jgi:hypothetical protein
MTGRIFDCADDPAVPDAPSRDEFSAPVASLVACPVKLDPSAIDCLLRRIAGP